MRDTALYDQSCGQHFLLLMSFLFMSFRLSRPPVSGGGAWRNLALLHRACDIERICDIDRFLHSLTLGRKERSDGIAIATVRSIASMTIIIKNNNVRKANLVRRLRATQFVA